MLEELSQTSASRRLKQVKQAYADNTLGEVMFKGKLPEYGERF